MGYIMFAGVVLVFFGLAGFSKQGLPFRAQKRLTGKSARAVGVFCCLIGAAITATAIAVSKPTERFNLLMVAGGILIGAALTWNAMRGTPWP